MSRVERSRPSAAPQLTPKVEPLKVGSTGGAQSGTPVVPDYQSTGSRHSGSADMPRYRQMERMDARIRPDQSSALSDLRKRVARNRRDKSERITESTLVRIAVDLLLEVAGDLTGDTETALRESVTTGLRK